MTKHENRGELIRLAGLLSARPISEDSYKLDELLTGLKAERKRLGQRKVLAVLIQKDFDLDGLTDWIFPLKSFDAQAEAEEYIKSRSASLYALQIADVSQYGKTWVLESKDEIPFMTAPESSGWASNIRVLYDQTYKIRATSYDTKYNCFRAIGPFAAEVVSDALFSFINQPSELWSYFVDVGEAIKKGVTPRQPL